jgi:hypothetical protein
MATTRKKSPARSRTTRARGSQKKGGHAAINRLNTSLDSANKAIGDLRGDLGRGGRDLVKNVEKLIKDARKEGEKLNKSLRAELDQLQERLRPGSGRTKRPAGRSRASASKRSTTAKRSTAARSGARRTKAKAGARSASARSRGGRSRSS